MRGQLLAAIPLAEDPRNSLLDFVLGHAGSIVPGTISCWIPLLLLWPPAGLHLECKRNANTGQTCFELAANLSLPERLRNEILYMASVSSALQWFFREWKRSSPRGDTRAPSTYAYPVTSRSMRGVFQLRATHLLQGQVRPGIERGTSPDVPSQPREEPPGEERPERRGEAPTSPPTPREDPPPGEKRPPG